MSARREIPPDERIRNRLELIQAAEDRLQLELVVSCIVEDLSAIYEARLEVIEPKAPKLTLVIGGRP